MKEARFRNADDLPRHFKVAGSSKAACGKSIRMGRKTENPAEVTCRDCLKAMNQ